MSEQTETVVPAIPEDLKRRYQQALRGDKFSGSTMAQAIERIAHLEQRNAELEAQLSRRCADCQCQCDCVYCQSRKHGECWKRCGK